MNRKWIFITIASSMLAQQNVVSVGTPKTVILAPSETVEVSVPIKVDDNYHVNSDKPKDPFLIPLKLTWTPGTVEALQVKYPKAQNAKLKFSSSPVSVLTGEFQITTRFKVAPDANGTGVVKAQLRYQACTDGSCLPPKTVEIEAPYEIRK